MASSPLYGLIEFLDLLRKKSMFSRTTIGLYPPCFPSWGSGIRSGASLDSLSECIWFLEPGVTVIYKTLQVPAWGLPGVHLLNSSRRLKSFSKAFSCDLSVLGELENTVQSPDVCAHQSIPGGNAALSALRGLELRSLGVTGLSLPNLTVQR